MPWEPTAPIPPAFDRVAPQTPPSRQPSLNDLTVREIWALTAQDGRDLTRERFDELLASVALYIDWRYVTKNLTTEQRELFADAIERDAGEPVSYAERWWRDAS
jgi:hypothetical protein